MSISARCNALTIQRFNDSSTIERLQALGLSRFWAAAIPVLIFAVGHSTSGWPNIIVALIAGSILAVFYQWRRDLLANMIGHFLVDFIGVVVPRFFS